MCSKLRLRSVLFVGGNVLNVAAVFEKKCSLLQTLPRDVADGAGLSMDMCENLRMPYV